MTTPEPDKKPGGLKGWLIDLVASLLEDPRVQAVIEKLLGKLITDRILPLVPIAAGSAATAAVNAALQKFPGLEGAVNVAVDTVEGIEGARQGLNDLIPDVDFGIPALDSVLDMWRPK